MIKQILILLTLCLGFQLQAQKILFVGNSLTYTNNLPLIFQEIANNYNKKITTETICFPNYAIVDHIKEGIIQKKIASENYDYVIIQQGPSSQDLGRKMLIDAGKILSKLYKKHNTQLGYYMVWPSKRYYHTFDKVIANHKQAAKKNNALLFPVGTYWKQYEKLNNKVSLYGSDQFHPSKTGSYFAALVIYHTLYPNDDLNLITFKDSKRWVKNKKTLKKIVSIIKDSKP